MAAPAAGPEMEPEIRLAPGPEAEVGGHRAAAPPAPAPPRISVIVPVYRHWDLAPGLLAALAAQSLEAAAFEVVLVDNAPDEPRPALALPPNARVTPCAAQGSYAARNAGVAAARGALLAFTDADCRPEPGWLAALDAAAAAPATAGRLLAGPVRLTGAGDPPNPYEVYDLIRGIPQERYVRHGYAATANLAVPAEVFAALGGFDARRRSGGDAAFCRRALLRGRRLAFVPEAAVTHPVRGSWEALAVKARRVKGGQITGGGLVWRASWLLRTLTPPLRATRRFLAAPRPWAERRAALGVLYRLWGVELAETARLLSGGAPERR
jgi:glycosyltransferase involved in cell wall biosynthesis